MLVLFPGSTAVFNLNLSARINRELGAKVAPTVHIPAANFEFTLQPGETLWTESSHKFQLSGIRDLARKTGFQCVHQWVDREWPFAGSLFSVEAP
jgi:L-histidine N-alpha-methyltransferase